MVRDSTLIIVAIITASLPGLITAIGMFLSRKLMVDVQAVQRDLKTKTEEYHLQINSRMDQLLASVRVEASAAGHAAGLQEGRAAGRQEGMALRGAQQAAMMSGTPVANDDGDAQDKAVVSEHGRKADL